MPAAAIANRLSTLIDSGVLGAGIISPVASPVALAPATDFPIVIDLANLDAFQDSSGNQVVLNPDSNEQGSRRTVTGVTSLGNPVRIAIYATSSEDYELTPLPDDAQDSLYTYYVDSSEDPEPISGTMQRGVDPVTSINFDLITLVVATTPTTASLSWAPVENADSYVVLMDGAQVGESTETDFSMTGLEPGTRHEFMISGMTASDAAVFSAASAVTLTAPTSTQLPDQSSISVEGTVSPGSAVSINDSSGAAICRTNADDNTGAFTCLVANADVQGTPWSVQQSSPKGAIGPKSEFTWGHELQMVTLEDAPAKSEPLNFSSMTVKGGADPGAHVTIVDGGSNAACDATAGADGYFECDINGLTPGESYEWLVHQELEITDSAGTRVATSAPLVFGIGFPAAPTIISPLSDEEISDGQVEIVGKADAGNTVTVLNVDRSTACVVDADSRGFFYCTVSSLLVSTQYDWLITQTDEMGHSSEETVLTSGVTEDVVLSTTETVAQQPSVTGPSLSGMAQDNKEYAARTFEFDYRTFIKERRATGPFTDACFVSKTPPENNGLAFTGDDRTFERPGVGGTFRTWMQFDYNYVTGEVTTDRDTGMTILRDAVTDEILEERKQTREGLVHIAHAMDRHYVSMTFDHHAGDPFCTVEVFGHEVQVGEISYAVTIGAWDDGTVITVGSRRPMPSHEAWYRFDNEQQWVNQLALPQQGFACLISDWAPCLPDRILKFSGRDDSLKWRAGSAGLGLIDNHGRYWNYQGEFGSDAIDPLSCTAHELYLSASADPASANAYTDFSSVSSANDGWGRSLPSLAVTKDGGLFVSDSGNGDGNRIGIMPSRNFEVAFLDPKTSMAIETDGTLWQWGFVSGVGDYTSGTPITRQVSDVPMEVMPGTSFVQADSEGRNYEGDGTVSTSVGVTASGQLYAWGEWLESTEVDDIGYPLYDYSPRLLSAQGQVFKEAYLKWGTVFALDADGHLWGGIPGEPLSAFGETETFDRMLRPSTNGSGIDLVASDGSSMYWLDGGSLEGPFELPDNAQIIDHNRYVDEDGALWIWDFDANDFVRFGYPLSTPNPQSLACWTAS